jgi:hypothetical protein
VGGCQGRPSSTHGGEEIRTEEAEGDPTPERAPAETVNTIAVTDPGPDLVSRVEEAATEGGALVPPEAPAGAAAGPGELPAIDLSYFFLSQFVVLTFVLEFFFFLRM